MTTEFYQPNRADIRAYKRVETEEEAVRLYCAQSYDGGRWYLQVRAPETLADGGRGKRFFIASAHMNRTEMKALRDAVDHALQEVGE